MRKNQILKTESFKLSKTEYEKIEQEKFFYEEARAASVEALRIVQKQRGWVSDNAIHEIADILDISSIDVEGIATFYSHIFRQPIGRYIIRYCDSLVCYIMDYPCIQTKLEKELNIKSGQTTSDRCFTLIPTCCLGNCDKGPSIMINNDTYNHLTPECIPDLLRQYI